MSNEQYRRINPDGPKVSETGYVMQFFDRYVLQDIVEFAYVTDVGAGFGAGVTKRHAQAKCRNYLKSSLMNFPEIRVNWSQVDSGIAQKFSF